jgi:Protein of unknown function (DUF3108)
MMKSSIRLVGSKKTLLLGIGFGTLSLLAHFLFVGWVGGAIEIPSWSPPIRDTPIEVSLFRAAPTVTPESLPLQSRPKKIVTRPVRKSPDIAKVAKVSDREPANEVAKVEPDAGAEKLMDKKVDVKEELSTLKDEVKPEIAPELPKIPNKASPDVAEVVQFPNGLGTIPVAGAFPYTFYYGDHTLNNTLGAGSFIVESGEGKYKLVLIGKASGLTSLLFSGATYRSEGSFGNEGFAPQLYAEKSGNRPERAAQVDYSSKEVTLGEQKKPTLLGMQDRISVIWQVGLILRAKPDFAERGKTLPIPLMSTRSLDNAQFVSQGIVDVDKRGALVKAVHFKFKPSNSQNKAQIDLWYDLNNLPQPLRIRWIDERDRTIDIFRDD